MIQSKQTLETIVQPHDPANEKLSGDEKVEAYEGFCGLIDDILLARMDSFLKDGQTGRVIPSVDLRITSRQDTGRFDSSLEISVSEKEDEHGLLIRSIQVSAKDRHDTHVRYHYEALEGSGEVIRRDESPIKESIDVSSEEDRMAGVTKKTVDLMESAENFGLEVDMGYNAQPVGPDEISKLRELIINAPVADPNSF